MLQNHAVSIIILCVVFCACDVMNKVGVCGKKCQLCREPTLFCSSFVKSEPAWLCHKELKLEAKGDFCCKKYSKNKHKSPTNQNICKFSGHLASLLGVPFNPTLHASSQLLCGRQGSSSISGGVRFRISAHQVSLTRWTSRALPSEGTATAREPVVLISKQVALTSEQVEWASEQVVLVIEQVILTSKQVILTSNQRIFDSKEVGWANEQVVNRERVVLAREQVVQACIQVALSLSNKQVDLWWGGERCAIVLLLVLLSTGLVTMEMNSHMFCISNHMSCGQMNIRVWLCDFMHKLDFSSCLCGVWNCRYVSLISEHFWTLLLDSGIPSHCHWENLIPQQLFKNVWKCSLFSVDC